MKVSSSTTRKDDLATYDFDALPRHEYTGDML